MVLAHGYVSKIPGTQKETIGKRKNMFPKALFFRVFFILTNGQMAQAAEDSLGRWIHPGAANGGGSAEPGDPLGCFGGVRWICFLNRWFCGFFWNHVGVSSRFFNVKDIAFR